MNSQAAVTKQPESVSAEDKQKESTPGTIECSNPATGELLGYVTVAGPDEVTDSVERARNAQVIWKKSSFSQRRAVLNRIMSHVIKHADELCEYIVKDSGKTFENAMMGEILPICTKIKWTVRYGEKHLKPETVGSGMFPHKKARIEYVPLGVVACIVPWNYPLQNIISSIVPPLMAGNSVVVKVSEAVAWSSDRFSRVITEALVAEGFPADTVQILNGFGETGAALVKSGVDKILFIGSVANGRRIIEGSAEHLTPVVMELGGKDPFIVCDDADLEKAVHSALGGSFINLGQNCVAAERFIIHERVYDEFVDRISAAANAMRQGVPSRENPNDVGAITTELQLKLIDRLVSDAVSKGAKVLAGGKPLNIDGGNFYPPTILAELTDSMDIVQEEVFGPVMLLFKVSNDQEAIEVANSTRFGLHSTVITPDGARGEEIAGQLQAGATCINDFGICYLNQNLPFGGVKYSGYGRMNGRDGLRAYTNHKAVLKDRLPIEIPPVLYPVGKFDYDIAKVSVNLMYTSGVLPRLKALIRLAYLGLRKKLGPK